ncbi:MAG: FAD-dependent oxidoreductase [Christensenellales bacterium]|jgi:NAD(P)H-nitrite reductase large subunit/rubredoxin|nr:FAD-dependent oxidoreductase [Clostridiales bacterium]
MKNTKWKCNVCGQVFSYLPEVCPVCGAAKTAFTEFVPEQIDYKKDTLERFVIVGGGIAAVQAAKAIRERNKTASVILVYEEDRLPYNRPALSDYICSALSFADLTLKYDSYYKANNIELMPKTTAVAIEKDNKNLVLSNGKKLPYTKLLIATGAQAFCPFKPSPLRLPIKTLRTYDDAKTLVNLLQYKGKNVIIAGGGILGIEAAVAFNRRGANVTVIERNPYIVKAQLDPKASDMLAKALEAKGIKILTSSQVKDIDKKGVYLDSGEYVQGDFMLVSMGVRSQIELAKSAEINVNRAIIVDDYMRTSIDDIYAAGDCAEHNGVAGGLWIISNAQGYVAGANMCGDEVKYDKMPFSTAFEGAGKQFFSVGNINDNVDESRIFEDQSSGIYKKLAFKENKLQGVILWQDTALSNKAIELVKKQCLAEEAEKILF